MDTAENDKADEETSDTPKEEAAEGGAESAEKTSDADEEKKEEYAKQLEDESTNALLTSWIDKLKEKAEIVIN